MFKLITRNHKTISVRLCACSYTDTNQGKVAEQQLVKSGDQAKTLDKVAVTQDKTVIVSKPEKVNLPSKEDLQWRTPWHQKEGNYFSYLRAFYSEDSNRSLLQMLHSPIDVSPSGIKRWWNKKKKEKDIIMQAYIPERNFILGNELAAAHFTVYRGGAVKFFGDNKWIKQNAFGDYSLPRHYDGTKILEAIDCEKMILYYEGLVNYRNLKQLKWLSVNGCETIDDWCLDRISYIFRDTLVYLDLRNCPNYTHRGLGALYKMNNLKILYVDDITVNNSFELTCLMLQQVHPDLDIRES